MEHSSMRINGIYGEILIFIRDGLQEDEYLAYSRSSGAYADEWKDGTLVPDICEESSEFEYFEEFIWWYNCRRPHQSLNLGVMEMPYKVFYRKPVDLIRGNCAEMIVRVMEEQKCV